MNYVTAIELDAASVDPGDTTRRGTVNRHNVWLLGSVEAQRVVIVVVARPVPQATAGRDSSHLRVPGPRPSAETGRAANLTQREREVARLVARGMSNRAIATELVVAEKTVKNHVQRILEKLDFSSRTQLAAEADVLGYRDAPNRELAPLGFGADRRWRADHACLPWCRSAEGAA